jgi:hypothetical protein
MGAIVVRHAIGAAVLLSFAAMFWLPQGTWYPDPVNLDSWQNKLQATLMFTLFLIGVAEICKWVGVLVYEAALAQRRVLSVLSLALALVVPGITVITYVDSVGVTGENILTGVLLFAFYAGAIAFIWRGAVRESRTNRGEVEGFLGVTVYQSLGSTFNMAGIGAVLVMALFSSFMASGPYDNGSYVSLLASRVIPIGLASATHAVLWRWIDKFVTNPHANIIWPLLWRVVAITICVDIWTWHLDWNTIIIVLAVTSLLLGVWFVTRAVMVRRATR